MIGQSEINKEDGFDIGWAVLQLRRGTSVSRRGWNGPGQYLDLEKGDPEKRILPHVWITTTQGNSVPWVCSQTDLLARDWYAV